MTTNKPYGKAAGGVDSSSDVDFPVLYLNQLEGPMNKRRKLEVELITSLGFKEGIIISGNQQSAFKCFVSRDRRMKCSYELNIALKTGALISAVIILRSVLISRDVEGQAKSCLKKPFIQTMVACYSKTFGKHAPPAPLRPC